MLTGALAVSLLLLAGDAAPKPAAAPAAKPPAAKGARFASDPLGFSAAFPCEVREATNETPSPAGGLTTRVFMCGGAEKGETAFTIAVMVPPAAAADQLVNLEFAKALLQGLAAQIATGAKGQVVHEGAVRSGTAEGYEVVVEAAGGHGRFRAFPVAGRLYQVMAIGAMERAAEADGFVESFALTLR